MWTRRSILRQAGPAAVLATTAPWWLVRRAHAARDKKLIVWNPAALAPQVDKIMQEQCYAYAKQAGIKESEIDYSIIGVGQLLPKLVASLEAGNPPDITRLGAGAVQFYRSQGHLLDVTDPWWRRCSKSRAASSRSPGASSCIRAEPMGFLSPSAPGRWSPVWISSRVRKSRLPQRGTSSSRSVRSCRPPPKLTGYGMCLGLQGDADSEVMNIIWSYGGKLVEADNKTVALHSKGTIAAVQFIADMYNKHKIIPKGAIGWDNTGNNKAYQSRQVVFVINATSIYAHLAESDKELYDVTGLLPVPAGPASDIALVGTAEWLLFKHNPYPEVAKGLAAYWMAPENLRVMIEEGDGRWGPPYPGMYASDFWKRPVFQHWHTMLERGRQFSYAGSMNAATNEVFTTSVVSRMMHRVLVENWEAEQAVAAAHKQVAEIYARHQEES